MITSIGFTGISKCYRRKTILDGIDLDLHQQECILLCGTNGAGKTTLLKIMAGLVKPDQGSTCTGLGEMKWRRCRHALQERIMYLHQHPYMFDASVRKNIAYALPRDLSADKRDGRINEALEWADLKRLASASAKSLSGGEAQRVALARAWLRSPSVLLLDEPTANMDQESRLRTHALLHRLKGDGMTILITSHDILQFQPIVDRTLLLEDGRISSLNPDRTDNVSAFPIDQTKHQQAR